MFASSLRTTIQKSAASFLPSSSVSPSLGGMDIHIRFRIEMDILDNLDIKKGRVAERKSAARPFFVLESTATGKNVENSATIHLK